MKVNYGEETKKALKNFPFCGTSTRMEFVLSIVQIKKVAAVANFKAGNISKEVRDAIIKSSNGILVSPNKKDFPLVYLQGGAGTGNNMNVNEVIASMATRLLKNKIKIHPNNHVNCSQSTNDVNPSALKISTFFLLGDLQSSVRNLINSLHKKSKEFKKIKKLGRTHLQDAVPTTLGAEFLSYAATIESHLANLKKAQDLCRFLNLGGTAIGNSVNASEIYIKEIYKELKKQTKVNWQKAPNMMSKTSSQADFLLISQAVTALAVDMSKMANDLKFMASGPRGGIGEILLPELQKGSSIMPGKVNPVMPETVNQLYFIISGNNLTIEKAVESSQMELGVMLPVVVEKLIDSIKLAKGVIDQFNTFCIARIRADREKCKYFLECSTAYATFLVPALGYDLVSVLVKRSVSENKTLREIVVGEKYLTDKDFEKFTNFG